MFISHYIGNISKHYFRASEITCSHVFGSIRLLSPMLQRNVGSIGLDNFPGRRFGLLGRVRQNSVQLLLTTGTELGNFFLKRKIIVERKC